MLCRIKLNIDQNPSGNISCLCPWYINLTSLILWNIYFIHHYQNHKLISNSKLFFNSVCLDNGIIIDYSFSLPTNINLYENSSWSSSTNLKLLSYYTLYMNKPVYVHEMVGRQKYYNWLYLCVFACHSFWPRMIDSRPCSRQRPRYSPDVSFIIFCT